MGRKKREVKGGEGGEGARERREDEGSPRKLSRSEGHCLSNLLQASPQILRCSMLEPHFTAPQPFTGGLKLTAGDGWPELNHLGASILQNQSYGEVDV